MPNESTAIEQASKPTKDVEVGSSSAPKTNFEAAAVEQLFGEQNEAKAEAEPLITRLDEEIPDAANETTEVASAENEGEDKSELVSMLKSDEVNEGNSQHFAWISESASDKEIAEGLNSRAAGDNSSFNKEDVKADHQFKSGDVIVFEKDGEAQVAYALTDFRGRTKFYRQNEDGEKRSYSSLDRAFPGMEGSAQVKVFRPNQNANKTDVADAGAGAEQKTESTPEVLKPVEITQAPIEARVEKTEVVDEPTKVAETNLSNVISERQALLSQNKQPTDEIQVEKDGKTETMTVAQRLKELDAQILDSRERPDGNDSTDVFRLEIVDPLKDGIREASDKLRVHDYVIKQSSSELVEIQKSGKQPTDLTGRQIMVNGKLEPETVADRAKELRTIIRDELARSLETAERNSPGPLNPEITRRIDVETAQNTVERTELMKKLGIMDPRLVNHENLDRMRRAKPETAPDIDRLLEVVDQGNRLQDVRHGLAYTKLRSAEMKAMGYANPELGLTEGGNPQDVRSAFTDLTQARDLDSAVRLSQAGYEVEIMVASKVAPLMVSVEQGLKYSQLDNKFQRLEKNFLEAGMDNQTRQNKELAQLQLAEEIDALLVLGNSKSSAEDKQTAIEELDRLSKNKINAQGEVANDVLAELAEAAKAGADRNLSREEIAIRLAAEKSTQLDLGFLNAESKRDFFRMRGLDGSIVDPDDPNRRVPTFADRFAMMRDVGARAKLERARTLQDLTNKSDQILEAVSVKYRGMSVEQVIARTERTNPTENKLLKAVATRYYGSEEGALDNVSIDDLMVKQVQEKDEAALLMLEVTNEAPHLIYKVDQRGDVTLIDDQVGKANFEARFGVSQADSQAFAEAKRRYERVADGSTTKDIDGSTIHPHVEIQKMKDLTLKMQKDVKRQKPVLQERVKALQLQKEALAQKSFTSEEARQMESERLQRQIDDINNVIKVRDQSMTTQSSLTKFMEATHEFAQGNHDNVVSLLDQIKEESPDMYKDENFGMEELRKNSDGWGGWFRRNWKTIAAVGAIAAGVVIGAATLGAGSPLSAALIAGGASTLTATAVGVGTFVVGTTAASTAIYSGTGRMATGEWNSDHAWEGFNTGLKTSAFMLAGYGVGAAIGNGTNALLKAEQLGFKLGTTSRITAHTLNRLQHFKLGPVAFDARYAVAGMGIQSVQTGSNLIRNSDKISWDAEGKEYLKGEAFQFATGSLINTFGLQFMGTGKFPLPGSKYLDPLRRGLTAKPATTYSPFFSRATLGNATLNGLKFTGKAEMYNFIEDTFKKGAHETATYFDIEMLGGKNQPNLDWLADRQGTFRDTHAEVGGARELLFRAIRPNHTVDWGDLNSRLQYNANIYDSGANFGLNVLSNEGLLRTRNPLIFQRTPQQPVERKVWIPEVSSTPMKLTYGYDGKVNYTPIVTDQNKPQGSRLQLRVDGLTGPDPHGFRIKRK